MPSAGSLSRTVTYEATFDQWSDTHWDTYGTYDTSRANHVDLMILANYYDRAMLEYAWWLRSADPTHYRRASAYIFNYRAQYLEPSAYKCQPHNWQPEGVALHYLLTGDEASRDGVHDWSDWVYPIWHPQLGDANQYGGEPRPMARILISYVLTHRLGFVDRDWKGIAAEALDKVLGVGVATPSYQTSGAKAGAWMFTKDGCNATSNFMNALLDDALIKYHDWLEADARITDVVKKNADYLWNTQWRPNLGHNEPTGSFNYYSESCATGGPTASVDVNGDYPHIFSWLGTTLKDPSYTKNGDTIFATLSKTPNDGNVGPYLSGEKQFNEAFFFSWRHLGYR